MLRWRHVFHFYQPPTQSLAMTQLVLKSCYLPLLETLQRHPQAHFTINLSGSLLEQLEQIPGHDFFTRVQTLVNRGQIELLQSPMYHPLLPLTDPVIVRRQIEKNNKLIKRLCGVSPINGLFPSELAVDESTLKTYTEFSFILVDESAVNTQFSLETIYSQLPNSTAAAKPVPIVVSRTVSELIRAIPSAIRVKKFLDFIQERLQRPTATDPVIVSLSDAEIFGHHYDHRLDFLDTLLRSENVVFQKITEAVLEAPVQVQKSNASALSIRPSTWQTYQYDFERHLPFPLWDDPNNPLHQHYKALSSVAHTALVQPALEAAPATTIMSAENELDRGLASCHPFWLSNSPWWHPDLALAGATQLIKAVRGLPLDHSYKQSAEAVFHDLSLQIWKYHWSDAVQQGYDRYDAHRAELLKNLPRL